VFIVICYLLPRHNLEELDRNSLINFKNTGNYLYISHIPYKNMNSLTVLNKQYDVLSNENKLRL